MKNCHLSIYLLIFLVSSCMSQKSRQRIKERNNEVDTEVCSPWFQCGWVCREIPDDVLKCSNNQSLSILKCNCITYNETADFIEVGKCIYNLVDAAERNYILYTETHASNETNMCKGINRTGTLCGNCRDGFFPLANSFDMACTECLNGKSDWLKFVLVVFLPLTVFYFVILLFNINITSSYLQGFYIYSQAVSTPALSRAIYMTNRKTSYFLDPLKFLGVFYGVWNLDFFRSIDLDICLGTDTLQTLALDIAVGIYPFLLMVVSYLLITLYDRNFRPLVVIWKPFRAIFLLFKRNWDVRTSLVDAFSTFFLLCTVKFLNVSYDLLVPEQVYQLNLAGNMTTSWRYFYNASLPYFGERHLPFATLAIALLLLFVLLPILLLVLYPFGWFHKALNLFPIRWHVLHTFMDSFQGCYKDGTQPGTRDCRWFASTAFFLRFLLIIIGMISFDAMYFPLSSMLLVMFVILLVNVEPFKESSYTNTHVIFMLHLALSYILTTAFGEARAMGQTMMLPIKVVASVGIVLPLLYISAIILHWMYRRRKFGMELFGTICARRRRYEVLEWLLEFNVI